MICRAPVLAAFALVGMTLIAHAQEPVDGKGLQQRHVWTFKGNPSKPADLTLLGPDAKNCVTFEDEGLRITLPAGWKGDRPGTGVQADLRLQGDFAIWMSFEILKEPARADAGKISTRLSLGISKDTAKKDRATNSRSVTGSRGSVFVTWASLWNNETGKNQMPSNVFPTKARTGKLRLVRSGDQLFYHAAEGSDGEWQSLTGYRFGEEDVINVRITAATGGDKAELDVRITEWHVDSIALGRRPTAATMPAGAPGDASGEQAGGGIPVRLMVAGGIIVAALCLALASWCLVRWRRRAGAHGIVSRRTGAALVSFACAACGKNLKARPDLAGRNVKCPHCAQQVLVPAS
ncbi:MAG: DUF1583 domain-containing protein [Gemmataceae bacterium]|nr:DUF1583 domain-containing protein [Gemmataceae bacterium]